MNSENWTLEDEEIVKPKKCCSGGCNKLETFDWLEDKMLDDPTGLNIFEVSFKNGSRKDFYRNENDLDIHTGDWVVVYTGSGYDVGQVSLSGELVRLQMKKKKVKTDKDLFQIQRLAGKKDLEKLTEARAMERSALIKAREIATSLKLDMKLGDVEYQGDKRKATFYYTAEGRVDFRELVKRYAREFRVKIEMRQIGIRQESSRIGGIGSCGRELCCSSWLTNFTSVTTETARYQNLAINQSKLTGLCGRLKCCLNYELDTYMEALEEFPKDAEKIFTEQGTAYLVKMDIFKGLLYYSMKDETGRSRLFALHKNKIDEILEMNKEGKKPESLGQVQYVNEDIDEDMDFEDVTGQIELPDRRKKRSRGKKSSSGRRQKNEQGNTKSPARQEDGNRKDNRGGQSSKRRRPNRNTKRSSGPPGKNRDRNTDNKNNPNQ
jgi:cell fate regulator YaaT (PSP1 superfamily)